MIMTPNDLFWALTGVEAVAIGGIVATLFLYRKIKRDEDELLGGYTPKVTQTPEYANLFKESKKW